MGCLRCTWEECREPAKIGRGENRDGGLMADLCVGHDACLTHAINSKMPAAITKAWQLASSKFRQRAA